MGSCCGTQKETKLVEKSRKKSKISYGSKFKQQGVAELRRNYFIDQDTPLIGSGSFGKVYKTVNRADDSMTVAVKAIDKGKIREDMEMLMMEIEILNKLDHPNIVKYFETYNDNKFVYLVMQFVDGQTLLEKLAS